MPYSAEISRSNPTCFLFLIDQSKSMGGPLSGDAGKKKADAVADSVNRLLYTLVLRCVWGQNVLDRFHVGVIGYGRQIASGLAGASGRARPGTHRRSGPESAAHRAVRHGDQTVKFPVWFEPAADGKTPMCATFERACMLLAGFLVEHPTCYPPMVINISDGEATDGDPEVAAGKLRNLSSDDGQVLLFNVHLSSQPGRPIEFPDQETALPDQWARRLFRMSSLLPPPMHGPASQGGIKVSPQTARLRLQRRSRLGGAIPGHRHTGGF